MLTLFSPENSNSPAEFSPPSTPTPLQMVTGDCDRKLRNDEDREMRINPATSFELPKGWVVESCPRGPNSPVKMSDKYYFEPGTGRKFRSLVSIKRYLDGEEEILPRKKQGNCIVPYQNSGSFRRVVYDGKLWTPQELEEAHYGEPNEIVPTTLQPKSSPLLPDGWVVESRPRGPNSSVEMSDKYYFEPGTGRKFRSLVSIKRYLDGEEEILPRKKQGNCIVPYQNSGSFRRVVYDGKLWTPQELEEAHYGEPNEIVPTTLQPKSSPLLPDGWVVESRPRGPNSSVEMSDKYYFEPGTGRKFRSLVSIKRYLDGEEEILPRKKQGNCIVPYQNSGSFRRVVYDGKLWTPAELEEAHYREPNEIVPTTLQPKSSPLLPDGWVVESRPRGPNSSVEMSDKYYYEPGTGRKFRSLVSIKSYLDGEEEILPRKKQGNCIVPFQNSGSFRRVVYDGKLWTPAELEEAHYREPNEIVPTTLQPKSSPLLPDGWFVEKTTRSCGLRSDRNLIEPGTGKRFRSVPEVQRYLEGEKPRSKYRTLTISNHATGLRSPSRRRKNKSVQMLRDAIIDLTNPPEKINWVFSGDGRDNWSPLVGECVLPDYVKEQWAETFLLGMNRWKQIVPQLTMGGNNEASIA